MADHLRIAQQRFMGMDLDSAPRNVGGGPSVNSPTGVYVEARNIHLGGYIESKGGTPVYMKGTEEIPWSAPAGVNKCIGSFYDARFDEKGEPVQGFRGWLYFMIYNSNGDHCVARYQDGNPQADIIIQTSELNFEEDRYITGANVVDDRFLQWTDYLNRPRELDVPYAILDGKTVKMRTYVLRPQEVIDQREFSATVGQGTTTLATVIGLYTATWADAFDFNPMMRGLVAAWNASTLAQYFIAEFCENYIEFTATQPGPDYELIINWIDTIAAVPQPFVTAETEYSNRPNAPWTQEQITRAKVAPAYPPGITLVQDNDRTLNLLEGFTFQFAYAVRFRDRSQSTLSPFSLLPIPQSGCGIPAANAVDIQFNDPMLFIPEIRGEIDFIELVMRNSAEQNVWGPWRSVKVIPKSEWIYNQSFRFYNDGLYPPIDEQYSQLLYSNIPLVAQSQEIITDNENNYRSLFGGTIEGYPNPCLDIQITPRYEEAGIRTAGGATVIARVFIKNLFVSPGNTFYVNNQPIWRLDPEGNTIFGGYDPNTFQSSPSLEDYQQILASNGFVFYMAGTDIIGITEQNVPTLNFTCGSLTPNTIPGTTVYNGQQTGTGSNPCNKTYRAAIREVIEAGEAYSNLEITGLVPGETYILRMADPRCSFGNAVDEFDLENTTRLYQKTSGRVLQVGSNASANVVPGVYECRITVPASGGTIDIGSIFVADLTSPGLNPAVDTVVKWGYLTDSEAQDNGGVIDIREGTPMERQAAHIKAYLPANIPTTIGGSAAATYFASQSPPLNLPDYIVNQGFCPTDHNGFWYFAVERQGSADLRNYRVGFASVTVNPAIPSGSFAGYTGTQFQTNNLLIGNNFNQNKWLGTWNSVLASASGNLGNTTGLQEYFMPNLSSSIHEGARTRVEGTIATPGGTPLQGVLVVLEDGSFDRTDSQGFYSIPTYGDVFKDDILNNNNNDRITNLIVQWDSACQLQITAGNIQPISILQFEENLTYSNLVPFIRNLQGNPVGNSILYARKRGGTKSIGVAWKDQYGVMSRIQVLGEYSFAHLTEDLNKYDPIRYPVVNTKRYGPVYLDWEINGDVPIPQFGRYRYLQFFETRDTAYNFYLQWAVASASYVSRFDKDAGEPVLTTFNSGTDNEIWLYIGDSFLRFREVNANSAVTDDLNQQGQIGYVFTPGDRVRIFTDSDGNWLDDFVDLEIKGQRGDTIVIDTDSRLPELKGGEFIEIMRPRPDIEFKEYYEIPGAIVQVNDPDTNPTWAATSGTLPGGDTYYLPTSVPIRPGNDPTADPPTVPWRNLSLVRESEQISDFYDSKFWHAGRINFADAGADQEYRPTLVRYSDPYLPQTTEGGEETVNGMNIFYPVDLREAERDYGLIMKMVTMGNTLICICSNKATFSIYVGVQEKNSQGQLTIVDTVLSQVRNFMGDVGTLNPESVVKDQGFVRWVDRASGKVVRYSRNGLTIISDDYRAGSFFRDKCQRLEDYDQITILGGVDHRHDEYLVTFKEATRIVNGIDITEDPDTILFYEKWNVWSSFMDYFPDFWGRTTQNLYSWRNGRMYLHNVGTPGEFAGVKQPMQIVPTGVHNPDTMKTWMSVSITATAGPWECPDITNEAGQRSSLIEPDFEIVQEAPTIFRAAFYKDENTPNVNVPLEEGDDLISRTLTLRASYNGSEQVSLGSIIMYYTRYELPTYP